MPALHRWLASAVAALLVAGAAGVAVVDPPTGARSSNPSSAAGPSPSATSLAGSGTGAGGERAVTPSTTMAGGPPGPGSAALAGRLIEPSDMGGYYHVHPDVAAAVVASAPCLASLGPSPSQSGRAVTALLGPGAFSVPTIVEMVASYPGGQGGAVFREAVAAIAACRSFPVDFEGSEARPVLVTGRVPPVADGDETWSGTFDHAGTTIGLQLGIVLDGQMVLALMWFDTVPGANPTMGGFTSTLSAAAGKLA